MKKSIKSESEWVVRCPDRTNLSGYSHRKFNTEEEARKFAEGKDNCEVYEQEDYNTPRLENYGWKKTVKSSMAGIEKGIQAIMDEYGCSREEAIEIMEEGIQSARKPVKSSRKPIQSMYVTEDISGNDLYTCLWSGGKDQFDSMIEDGADADDILNACEELLFREEGNPPTMTELNDLIWFEPDTIREYIGLSNPIESGCHGKSKKKDKKKAVKSAKKSVKSAYNPWNGEGSIRVSLEVVEDGEHSSPDFSNTVMDLDDFVAECKGYAESCNGYYFVSENDSNSYKIEFRTGDDSFTDNPGTDPYYEESCGTVIAELIYPYTTDMADYIENGGY